MHKKRIFYMSMIIFLLVLVGCSGIVQNLTKSLIDAEEIVSAQATQAEVDKQETDSGDIESSEVYCTDDEDQIIAIYKSASPSVVNITSVAYVFNRMLGQMPEEGVGSGFIFDSDGHIITNYHVIDNADELIVTLSSGEKLNAVVVGVDQVNDIAVLRVDAGDALPAPLPLADLDQVEVGQTVLAIGNPYGLDWTLTTGVVSALGRVIESTQAGEYIAEAIQTDAAINPGNSGGPLLNTEGQVIGITSQIISESGSSSGLGFAVSANTIQRIVPDIIEKGYYRHPWLGVETIELTDYSIAILEEAGMDIPIESGVLVVGIESGSPAQEAGISPGDQRLRYGPYIIPLGGDIITAINGVQVDSKQDLMVYLETETNIGDTIQLSINRDGKSITVEVKLMAQRPTSY